MNSSNDWKNMNRDEQNLNCRSDKNSNPRKNSNDRKNRRNGKK